jgi:EmrB/QacA subfamily drug resistance transporter
VTPHKADPTRQHHHVTLWVLVTGALAYTLSQTLIAPALPEIQKQLHTSTTAVTFALTTFLLTASVATPIAGRLGDIFGKQRMLVITLCIFGTGSLVAALSHSIGVLILGRAIQGIGGSVFPLSFGIIRDEFPRKDVSTGIGLLSATFGIGGAAGLVLSGVIVDHLAYEWIFWLGFIVSAIAVVTTFLFVPESPVKSPARIDWAGAAGLSTGLVCLLLGVSQGNTWGWGDPRVIGLFAAAALVFTIWVRWEDRTPQPLVDMRMMRARGVWTTNMTALLVGFGMFGSYILIPRFVQVDPAAGFGFGASVTMAGVFMLPSAVVMLVGGPIAGWMGGRGGSRLPLLMGTGIAAASFTFLALEHSTRLSIYIGTTLMGVGIAFAFASMANLIVEAVDQTQTGVATGMNTIMRTIGGSLGGQLAASIVAAHVGANGLEHESGYVIAFVMSAVGLVGAFACALLIPLRRPANGGDAPDVRAPMTPFAQSHDGRARRPGGTHSRIRSRP